MKEGDCCQHLLHRAPPENLVSEGWGSFRGKYWSVVGHFLCFVQTGFFHKWMKTLGYTLCSPHNTSKKIEIDDLYILTKWVDMIDLAPCIVSCE